MYYGKINVKRRYSVNDFEKIAVPRRKKHKFKTVAFYVRRFPFYNIGLAPVCASYECACRGVNFVAHKKITVHRFCFLFFHKALAVFLKRLPCFIFLIVISDIRYDFAENIKLFCDYRLHRLIFRLKSVMTVFAVECLYRRFVLHKNDGDVAVLHI